MKRGKFIVFEGIDGSGKTTQVELLRAFLEYHKVAVHVTKEPSDRFVGKAIRMVLEKKQVVPHETLAAMFLADRYDHILGEGGMLEMLDKGISVICDRYYWSSFAYHSLDLDMGFVIDLHKQILQLLTPDITIFLDIDPNDSLERVASRSGQRDLFEKNSILTQVRENYLKAFELIADQKVYRADASQSIEDIQDEIVMQTIGLFGI